MIEHNGYQLYGLVMWLLVILSTGIVVCEIFGNGEFESNYEMNKINKGVWLRKKSEDEAMSGNSGHFFFRSMSNENEPFNSLGNAMSFLPRDKRSTPSKRKRQIKAVKGQAREQDSKTSLFSDFPLGVAMLLENSNNKNIDYSGYPKYETKALFDVKNETRESAQAINKKDPKENDVSEDDTLNYLKDLLNITEGNATAKRSMKYDELVVDRIDLLEMFNKSKDFNKVPNVKEDQMWQTAPVPDSNLYEILPKEPKSEPENPKPVTERGLIKVLSMLTRTFRKIMKQHSAIKMIHDQMNNINKEFNEKIEINTKKLNDFDVKYTTIMKIMDKLKTFQDCLKNKEEMYKNKEEVMAKNLLDFESQQKKFLAQQQQFYNIQKMMLAQNEKINAKQNSIAKMQNEISHRQNHFARVLKKAKQALQNNKYSKLNSSIMRPKVKTDQRNTTKKESMVTTVRTTSVEPVTINLFSIAPNTIIEDHDQMILKEKDDKSVDDLIYKYYFNNTFIDSVIKNKILGGVLFGDKITIARNAKLAAKRNQSQTVRNKTEPESTILFPVNNNTNTVSLRRERRWINHHSKRKHRKRHHSKGQPILNDPNINNKNIFKNPSTMNPNPKVVKESDLIAKDPFLVMATSFCNEIGQSSTKQILDWCVEKAIRRLRTLDMKMVPAPALVVPTPHPKETTKPSTEPPVFKTTPITPKERVTTTISPTVTQQTQSTATKPDENQFFPDNEKLESNLKEFDNMTPDTAGNVYYEGSLHASDILDDKSDGLSDILPEFDSNSKVDIDTRAIQLQLRRKYLRENMEHKRHGAVANAQQKLNRKYA